MRHMLLSLIAVGLTVPPAYAASAGTTLAVVNGDTLTTADLDGILTEILAGGGNRGGQLPEPDAVLKRLVQNRLLEQEGYRIGADQEAVVRNQVDDLIRTESVKRLLDDVSVPSPDQVSEETEEKEDLPEITNVMRRYSHILVKNETLARMLADSLELHVSFADLARRHSVDGNAQRGGDLGWAAEGVYVPEFENVARALQPGETSDPVQTEFGWHLITLTDSRVDTLSSATMRNAAERVREQERIAARILDFIAGLKKKHAIAVDDSLVSSLDYATEDPTVQEWLKSSDAVIVALPAGKLTVKSLTRNIRFRYFHGLAGRKDAGEIRDRMLEETISEALLATEARERGYHREPAIVAEAERFQRRLVREEIIKNLVSFDFAPTVTEVAAFYADHLDDFTPPPGVRVRSVLISSEAAARTFKSQLESGTDFRWLVDRTAEVIAGEPPIPTDWLTADALGVDAGVATVGRALGPKQMPDGWAVAQITSVEPPSPTPLDLCRDKVIGAMRAERIAEVIRSAVERLEAVSEITIAGDATTAIAGHLEKWRAGGEGDRS